MGITESTTSVISYMFAFWNHFNWEPTYWSQWNAYCVATDSAFKTTYLATLAAPRPVAKLTSSQILSRIWSFSHFQEQLESTETRPREANLFNGCTLFTTLRVYGSTYGHVTFVSRRQSLSLMQVKMYDSLYEWMNEWMNEIFYLSDTQNARPD